MKVDAKLVRECFNEVKALLIGVDEVFRDGYYVEEGISSIADNIKTVLNSFAIDHMTPVQKEAKREHYFLSRYDELRDRVEMNLGLDEHENTLLYNAKIYLFLKRAIRDQEIPSGVNQAGLVNWIEANIISDSPFSNDFAICFSRDYYRMVELVAKETIAHILKNPQMTMDLKPKEAGPVSLLDKINAADTHEEIDIDKIFNFK